jgi:serine protease
MRLLTHFAAIAAIVLGSSMASAQMNSSNDLPLTGDEVVGEIAIEANDLSSSDLKQLKLDYNLHANSTWSDDHDEIEIANVTPEVEDTVINAMKHDARIKFVSRQHIFHADGWTPNDPMFDKQWHMKRVGAPTSWTYTAGMGAVVAVVDTGVDETLSDLQGTKFNKGYNFVDDSENTNDGNAHGSHCSGTVAQTTNNGLGVAGLSYKSTILPVKVLSDRGSGTMAGVAEGIRFAADNGANVISLSLGTSQADDLTRDAVAYAISKNVLVVAAAGNNGDTAPHYPSNYPGVVCVSATDENDHLAKFSTHGKQIVIAAPGVNVLQQIPGGEFKAFAGTSMACPHVAAASGLMVSLGLRGNAIRDALTSNADDKNEPTKFGAGILNAGKAVRSVYWHQFLIRVIALFGFATFLKRRIAKANGSPMRPGVVAMLLTSTGLLPFLPLTGLLPKLGSFRILGELAMRPVGMWDTILLSANVHNWLFFASAIPAVVALITCYGMKWLRGSIGGVALGSAALMTQLVISNDGDWSLIYRGLMLGSIGACFWVGRLVLDARLNDTEATIPSTYSSSR